MTPFAIAGIQMNVDALTSNVDAMIQKCDILMSRFPWTQMVLFSELAPFGPLHKFAQAFPNNTEEKFQALAHRHGIWLIPGSMFELDAESRVYNTASVINPEGVVVKRY